MKTNPARAAFTLVELLVVIATLAVLGTLLVHGQLILDKAKVQRISCVSNLKQVGLSQRMWSNDNNDHFPMQVEAKKGGSLEAIKAGETFRHYQALSNELTQVRVLVCPSDTRKAAADFNSLRNTNLSYFVAIDADETKAQMLLSGDRNVTNGVAPVNTLLGLGTKAPAGWTDALHNEAGNIGLADGSAQQMTTAGLRRQLEVAEQAKSVDKDGNQRIQLPEFGSGSE